jgi:hypothetical protein
MNFVHTQYSSGVALFLAAVAAQLRRNNIWIGCTLIAAGEQPIDNRMTGIRPTSDGCATEKFGIIWMCQNDEDMFGFLPRFENALHLPS